MRLFQQLDRQTLLRLLLLIPKVQFCLLLVMLKLRSLPPTLLSLSQPLVQRLPRLQLLHVLQLSTTLSINKAELAVMTNSGHLLKTPNSLCLYKRCRISTASAPKSHLSTFWPHPLAAAACTG